MTETLSPPVARMPAHGTGELVFSCVGGATPFTAVTRASAQSPLRLLTPRASGRAAWAFTSSYGGGLVGGDHLDLRVHAEAKTTCYLSTQSSTKVFKSSDGGESRQDMRAVVDEDALLVVTPDPVVCFADARYRQTQRFEVAPSGSLVLLDWFTSGRHARGERWAFTRFESRNDIYVSDCHVAADVLRLSDEDGPLGDPLRMGAFNCFATLVLIGPRVSGAAARVLAELQAVPVVQRQALVFGVSPLADGLILRVAAVGTEQAARFLYAQLTFLTDLLGEHPWLRKW